MAEAPQNPTPRVNSDEIPLEEIDKLLEQDDPEFTKQLEEVKSVGADSSVEIESAVVDESGLAEEADFDEKSSRFPWLKKNLGAGGKDTGVVLSALA